MSIRRQIQRAEPRISEPGVWRRTPKGGNREPYLINGRIVGVTTGDVVFQYTRRFATVRQIVSSRNVFKPQGDELGSSLYEAALASEGG